MSDPAFRAMLDEKNKEIQNLKEQLKRERDCLDNLIADIDTPSRLGLSEPPNPNWEALNKARETQKMRGKDE